MKFITVSAILFTTVYSQEEPKEEEVDLLDQNSICAADKGKTRLGECKPGLCCGRALEEAETSESLELKTAYICNEALAFEWIDEKNIQTIYGFKCLVDSANKLALSTMVLLGATIMMS